MLPTLLITSKTCSSHLVTIPFSKKVKVLIMAPTENSSSSKTEQEASKKSFETVRHIGDAEETSAGKVSPHEEIKWYREEIVRLHPSMTLVTTSCCPPPLQEFTDQGPPTERPISHLSIARHPTRESKRCRIQGLPSDQPA